MKIIIDLSGTDLETAAQFTEDLQSIYEEDISYEEILDDSGTLTMCSIENHVFIDENGIDILKEEK